ncbi:MAG: hypothetical protein NTV89_10205, partial [Proteobacteria bacterium]|nr:hypothetical protein [Pseudomonadota bacterium]
MQVVKGFTVNCPYTNQGGAIVDPALILPDFICLSSEFFITLISQHSQLIARYSLALNRYLLTDSPIHPFTH